MEKIALVFIFILVCQSSQFSPGHGDLHDDSLHIQSEGELFTLPQEVLIKCLHLGKGIIDADTADQEIPMAGVEDVQIEKENDGEMRFHSRYGDYYPDYEEFLSNHHGGL